MARYTELVGVIAIVLLGLSGALLMTDMRPKLELKLGLLVMGAAYILALLMLGNIR